MLQNMIILLSLFQSMHMQIHIIPKEPLMELWKNGWNTRKMK